MHFCKAHMVQMGVRGLEASTGTCEPNICVNGHGTVQHTEICYWGSLQHIHKLKDPAVNMERQAEAAHRQNNLHAPEERAALHPGQTHATDTHTPAELQPYNHSKPSHQIISWISKYLQYIFHWRGWLNSNEFEGKRLCVYIPSLLKSYNNFAWQAEI